MPTQINHFESDIARYISYSRANFPLTSHNINSEVRLGRSNKYTQIRQRISKLCKSVTRETVNLRWVRIDLLNFYLYAGYTILDVFYGRLLTEYRSSDKVVFFEF